MMEISRFITCYSKHCLFGLHLNNKAYAESDDKKQSRNGHLF